MLETRTAPSIKPAPVETVTPIKPSEAIRLGRLLVPARSVGALTRRVQGTVVAACALGAMAVGFGASSDRDGVSDYWWPSGFDAAPRVKPPCSCYPEFLNRQFIQVDRLPGRRVWDKHRAWRAPVVVAHLSDDHGGRGGHSRLGDYWPTARIADWLEGLGL